MNVWMNKENMVCLYNRILFLLKQRSSAICSNVDTPGEHWITWNKPVTVGQIPHNPIYVRNLKPSKP